MSPNQFLNQIIQDAHPNRLPELQQKFNVWQSKIVGHLQKTYKGCLAGSIVRSGSVSKGTTVNLSYDVDLIVPFKHGEFGHDHAKMKADVLKCLQRAYPSASIREQRASIGIKMQNHGFKGRILDFDIVPGLELSKGNYNSTQNLTLGIGVPSRGEQVHTTKTNIHKQIAFMKRPEHNQARQVVKLLKIWKLQNGQKISSFFIELIVCKAFHNYNPPKSKGLLDHLIHVASFIAKNASSLKLTDPGNSHNNVAASIEHQAKQTLANRMREIHADLSAPNKSDDKLLSRLRHHFKTQ